MDTFQQPGITKGSWQSHHGPMWKIDFSMAETLKDQYGAIGCITVLTSDGKLGTMTHLDTSDIDNVDDFFEILNTELGEHKKDSKVILSGGSKLKQSQEFYSMIKVKLAENGYSTVYSYIDNKTLAPKPKTAELWSDKAVISKLADNKVENHITEISFANGKMESYMKAREVPNFQQFKK